MKSVFIVIGGSVAAGKTTLAYKLKNYWQTTHHQTSHVIEDDTERRTYLGYSLKQPMRGDEYSDAINFKMQTIMDEKTSHFLAKIECVIRTIVRNSEAEYHANKVFADERNAEFIGIFLKVSEDNIKQRILSRGQERETLNELSLEMGHASDVDIGILEKLPIPNFIPAGWIIIDADQEHDKVFEDVIAAL